MPIYASLEHSIRRQIRAGTLKPGQKLGSTAGLAKEWGVSPATARQSLQILASQGLLARRPGAGTFVSAPLPEETDGAQQEGRSASREPQAGTSLALLVPDIMRPEYAFLARGIQDAAHERGLDVVVSSTDDEPGRYDQLIERQIKAHALGLVMVPPYHAPLSIETLYKIDKSGIPVVTCYRAISSGHWPLVCSDNQTTGFRMAQHLCELGRKRIAFLGAESGQLPDSSDYHYGFMRGMVAGGGQLDDDLRLVLKLGPRLGMVSHEAAAFVGTIEEWLQAHADVDGICAMGDGLARAAIKALQNLGRRVSRDVAVVGHGGLGEYFGFAPGELTSIETPFRRLGQEACELIFAMRQGKTFAPHYAVRVKNELRIGKTTVGEYC